MKFSPCTDNCTKDGTHCQGCGRSHQEIQSMSAIGVQLLNHLIEYDYDDPEVFLDIVSKKALLRLQKHQQKKCK
ncbi:MAG: hypothetical protein ACJAZP_000917 [Psychromonas sp.]|jgi:hypothetical protein|uniref:DUF1289 domain-containing protein n=1 Tax=Psychromonas sp. TaxID=1884585 RepID=UPI0039E38B92